MVYLHIPPNFTEEELMLQAKYEKLKRKKKALQNLKAPRQEPERTTPVKRPQMEARDAREIAKKLIKSGAIAAIQKPPKRDEQAGFKRPRGLERKLERTISGYQPFSATHLDEEEIKPNLNRPHKEMYEQVTGGAVGGGPTVVAGRREERTDKPTTGPATETRQGNTVFVAGYSITKPLLEKAFSQCGPIIDISMELEKDHGFVTFAESASAERAINDLDGTVVGQSKLKVSFAWRQPFISASPHDVSPASKVGPKWQTVANNHAQKANSKDTNRVPVNYSDLY